MTLEQLYYEVKTLYEGDHTARQMPVIVHGGEHNGDWREVEAIYITRHHPHPKVAISDYVRKD